MKTKKKKSKKLNDAEVLQDNLREYFVADDKNEGEDDKDKKKDKNENDKDEKEDKDEKDGSPFGSPFGRDTFEPEPYFKEAIETSKVLFAYIGEVANDLFDIERKSSDRTPEKKAEILEKLAKASSYLISKEK